jgi:hypothetical protein
MAIRSFSQGTNDNATECEANTGCAPNDVKGKVQELASAVAQEVKDVATDVSNKAQDWAGNVANKAQETASAAVDKTNDGIAAVGHQIRALGGAVRDAAPQKGALGSAATTVAADLQAGGRYLEGHGLEAIGKDLTDAVKHYPMQAVLVGFGLGCLVGMTLLRGRS